MERFIFQVVEPFISKDLEQGKRKENVKKINEELKMFIKGQLGPLNKEIAKKTRELFVATSDIENYKQSIDLMQRDSSRLRAEVSTRENDIFKQKIGFEKQLQELKEQNEKSRKEIKNITKKFESSIETLTEEFKEKVRDMKKLQKTELQSKLAAEISHWESEINNLKEAFSVEKNHLVQQTSKEKSRLIKKYEEKIYTIKSEFEETLEKTVNDFTLKLQQVNKYKNEIFNKLTVEEANYRRVSIDLEKQMGQNRTFKTQFESTLKELEESRKRHAVEMTKLEQECENAKIKLKEYQKKSVTRIKDLQMLLDKTILQKDKRFTDTVETMNTEHRIEIESMNNTMMEEREVILSNMEVKAYEDMFQQLKRYEILENSHRELQTKYDTVQSTFQLQFNHTIQNHSIEIENLQQRKDYQYELSEENAKREYNNLLTKFMLEVRSLKSQHAQDQEVLLKKAQEEKIAQSNKLIGQYQAMLADQRSNNEIQIKQKLMEFQRKGKAYEKRIAEAEKRKAELKVAIERMKIESQMKIESMMEVNQKFEEEIQGLHQRILELEKGKSTIINDYQFQILLLKNEMEKLKEEYREREDELRANLNQKIIVKNKEIARLAERVKLETEELIKKHKERVTILQRQYEELKRVIKQKTSLPQDIEALQIFHVAYLEKQNQLISQRRKREQLQRELNSKDAIEKVFASKEAFKRLIAIDKMATTYNHFQKG